MKEIKTKNGSIYLKSCGNSTFVDIGKKVLKLPMELEKAVEFIKTLNM